MNNESIKKEESSTNTASTKPEPGEALANEELKRLFEQQERVRFLEQEWAKEILEQQAMQEQKEEMRLREQSRAGETSEDSAMQKQEKVSAIKNMEKNNAPRPPLLEVGNSFVTRVLVEEIKSNLCFGRSN